MDDHPTDAELLRASNRQLGELRSLLEAVATALERLATNEPDPERRRMLLAHAARLRRRLFQA